MWEIVRDIAGAVGSGDGASLIGRGDPRETDEFASVDRVSPRMMQVGGLPSRALIAGLGHMGSLHARVLDQIEGVEVIAAVDEAIERLDIDFAYLAVPAEMPPVFGAP